MINAWSLLYEELNGTMDKTYPIENNELNNESINITTGIGNTAIYNVPDDVEIDDENDDTITITGGDFVNFDVGVGITDCVSPGFDTLNLDFSGIEGINLSSAFSDNIVTFDDTPTPGIESNNPRKYKEDESIKALQDYISTTYGGHYTSDNNNVQTLDLIESVGDAEAFCRSNAIKYLSRYDKKGQAKRDILKALHYSLLLYHFSGQLNETPTRGYETF